MKERCLNLWLNSQGLFRPKESKGLPDSALQMDPGSRAREVAISCPYWIINKTNVVLRIKDTTLNSKSPVAAPPGLGKQADAVLFRPVLTHCYISQYNRVKLQASSVTDRKLQILHTLPILILVYLTETIWDHFWLHEMQEGQRFLLPFGIVGPKKACIDVQRLSSPDAAPRSVQWLKVACWDLLTCSTARGSMRLGVLQGAWSKAINLENLGLHHSFHVLGPQQVQGRSMKLTEGEDESIMHFDCEKIIAPRGQSPRRSRYLCASQTFFCVNDIIIWPEKDVTAGGWLGQAIWCSW